MKASKTLGRPENWQDFETLCKKLWGEIWKCPEIKKNGRSGQKQLGVDVCGIPKWETEYYGIQCKGKDEYTHKQLTEEEIDKEIKKAKKFTPALKKFYFATTAVKDAKIEEIIRKRNIENKKNGLFEVHIFSWEDIVDLIYENRDTYNYYVNSISFKSTKSVDISFHDGSKELTMVPKFRQRIIRYNQKIAPANPTFGNSIHEMLAKQQRVFQHGSLVVTPMSKTEINYSYCQFYIMIHNNGTTAIEDYKLFLEFEGDVKDIAETNENSTGIVLSPHIFRSDIVLNPDELSGKVIPENNILVGDDIYNSDNIFIKTSHTDSKIIIKWKLVSKDYKNSGELFILSKPDIERHYKTVLVEGPLKVRIKEGEIEDFIVDKKRR